MSRDKNKMFSVVFNTAILKENYKNYSEVYNEGITRFGRYFFMRMYDKIITSIMNYVGINTSIEFYEINKLAKSAEEAVIDKIIDIQDYIIPEQLVTNHTISKDEIIARLDILSTILYTFKYKVKINVVNNIIDVRLELSLGYPSNTFFEEIINI